MPYILLFLLILKNDIPMSNYSNNNLANYVIQKVPPQAIPVEEAVLGALMTDRDALSIVIDMLTPQTFYLERHQLIYAAILHLYNSGDAIDLLTVKETLLRQGVLERIGNAVYLADLTSRVGSAANLEYHARILNQYYIIRQLINLGNNLVKEGNDGVMDAFELLDAAEKEVFSLQMGFINKGLVQAGQTVTSVLKKIEQRAKNENGIAGLKSGFTNIDNITGGWQEGHYIVIAARPSMGKTILGLNFAWNAAKAGKSVAFFSLEMSSEEIVERLECIESGLPNDFLKSGKLEDSEWEQLIRASQVISKMPFFMDDTSGIDIQMLRSKCRKLKMTTGLDMVVIDYLQLIETTLDKGNREQQVSFISRSLKALAKELKVPVIALSQLSRAVEVRGGSGVPKMSDLRESGSIEMDADMVGFIYRPAYYGIFEDEQGNSIKDLTDVIFAKNRHGKLGTAKLTVKLETGLFLERQPYCEYLAHPVKPENSAAIAVSEARIPAQRPTISDEETPF
jgi:replicative DNA helicase